MLPENYIKTIFIYLYIKNKCIKYFNWHSWFAHNIDIIQIIFNIFRQGNLLRKVAVRIIEKGFIYKKNETVSVYL